MDGFNQSEAADYGAYTRFMPEDLPNYWHWAEQFVLFDNFFTSAHGPSFPNHLFAIAAQSGGAYENPGQNRDDLERRHRETGLFKAWGCDSLSTALVGVKDREGNVDRVFPCLDFETGATSSIASGSHGRTTRLRRTRTGTCGTRSRRSRTTATTPSDGPGISSRSTISCVISERIACRPSRG